MNLHTNFEIIKHLKIEESFFGLPVFSLSFFILIALFFANALMHHLYLRMKILKRRGSMRNPHAAPCFINIDQIFLVFLILVAFPSNIST